MYYILLNTDRLNRVDIALLNQHERGLKRFTDRQLTAKTFDTYFEAVSYMLDVDPSTIPNKIIQHAVTMFQLENSPVQDFQFILDTI